MFNLLRSVVIVLVSGSLVYSVSTLANDDLVISKDINGKGIQVTSSDLQEKDEPKVSKKIEVKVNSDGRAPVEIIVPVAFFMTFPACLFLIFWFRFRSTREKQITLRTMVENGANIPTEMFLEGRSKLSPVERDRKNGILFSLSSIGLIIFLVLISSTKGLWAMGLVPLLLGVGYLVNWKLASKENSEAEL